MTRYFAFLRGINVGGHTVKMDRLRQLLHRHGFEGAETFIASGNVTFESAARPAQLERALEALFQEELGYEVATFLRSAKDMSKVAERVAVAQAETAEGDSLYVVFLRKAPTAALRREVEGRSNDVDHLQIDGREMYWRVKGKLMDSTLGAEPGGKALGPTTMRNATTITRLATKYDLA
jgi:uncharacterized protein (DUF1697 family)